MLARAFTAPLLAVWADSFKLRRTALVCLSPWRDGALCLMALPGGFAWWTVVWFAASSMYTTLSPLTDVIVLGAPGVDGFNYRLAPGHRVGRLHRRQPRHGRAADAGSLGLVLVWMVAAAWR